VILFHLINPILVLDRLE